SASGFVDCFATNTAANTTYAAINPTLQGPQQRVVKYTRVLPSVGVGYGFDNRTSVVASYSKNLSLPATDNLYNAFFFPANTAEAQPAPETTDSFDFGVRYRTSALQAQLSGWYTTYQNRTASAYDPVLDATIFRNLGTVEKYGIDGSIAWQPIPELALYAFGSYLKSKIKDNTPAGTCSASNVSAAIYGCTVVGAPAFNQTAGKRESGAPEYTLGGSARGTLGPVELGVTAKRTGPRYINDENLPVRQIISGTLTDVYPAKAPAYWLVNLDARLNLAQWGLEKTHFQLNVYNLFDQFYVGGFSGGPNSVNVPFVQIGAPRTVSGTMVIAF
ncbi:MAG: TonB-dependent receptor, partial [Sphingomonadales bacterium]|nr:TonB-dependent receptor [Sphingomonadales bacterium]